MKIVWSVEALAEIEAIIDYIAQDNPIAALELADGVITVVETLLRDNPNAGRPGRVAGTRELVTRTSYIVAYQVSGETVDVLTVRHAARLWPEEF